MHQLMLPCFYFLFSFPLTGIYIQLKLEQNSEVNRLSISFMFFEIIRTLWKLVYPTFNQKFLAINKTNVLDVVVFFTLFCKVCVAVCVPVWSKETVSERLVSNKKTSSDRDNVALPPSPNTHARAHTRPDSREKHI